MTSTSVYSLQLPNSKDIQHFTLLFRHLRVKIKPKTKKLRKKALENLFWNDLFQNGGYVCPCSYQIVKIFFPLKYCENSFQNFFRSSNWDFGFFWVFRVKANFSRPWPEKIELSMPFWTWPDPKMVRLSRPWPKKPEILKPFKALTRKNLKFGSKLPGWPEIRVRSPHTSRHANFQCLPPTHWLVPTSICTSLFSSC